MCVGGGARTRKTALNKSIVILSTIASKMLVNSCGVCWTITQRVVGRGHSGDATRSTSSHGRAQAQPQAHSISGGAFVFEDGRRRAENTENDSTTGMTNGQGEAPASVVDARW